MFAKGKLVDEIVLNIDLAPTWLDLAGLPANSGMHGKSFKELAAGKKPADWRTSFLSYYRKELGDTPTCVGVRTATQKLIHYHGKPDLTEAYDLAKDPYELNNLAKDNAFTAPLRKEMNRLANAVKYPLPEEVVVPLK